jgi:hypothetical protein
VKKDTKAWAIKLRGRSLLPDVLGHTQLFKTLAVAQANALKVHNQHGIKAEPIRVRVRIEEIE